MKKALVITYYWPPSGGGGVQRWLKFVKYLREFDYEPMVYTPANQNAPNTDTDLLKDIPENLTVIKKPIWEPYDIYKWFTGKSEAENIGAAFAHKNSSNSLKENLSNWIRSNFFIPDARCFWIKPSVKFLSDYLKKNQVDLLVTTGPPHSLHIIGLKLKEKINLTWVADFRDPWTDIDYYNELKLSWFADKKHHALEHKVLQGADHVICVSPGNKKKLIEKGAKNISVVFNGYDEEDIVSGEVKADEKFSLVHLGTFMNNRNPDILWKVLGDLIAEFDEFRKYLEIKLIGKVDGRVVNAMRSNKLDKFLKLHDSVSHSEAIRMQRSATVLLLLVNKSGDTKGMVTGKVFEYLAAGRPILAIGPEDGDLAGILKETKTGLIADFDDETMLRKNILDYFEKFKSGKLVIHGSGIERYSRKNLTAELAGIFDSLLT